MADKLKMGILGVGPIAQIAHLPALAKAENVEFTAVCDAAGDLAKKLAARYDVPAVFTDHRSMLSEADIDAVLIPTAHQFHAPLSIDAMKAGKHVLVEKPLAVTLEECEEMVAVSEATGKQLQMACMKRYDPALQFAQAFVRGKMGDPLLVSGWYCDTQFHGQYVRSIKGGFAGSPDQKRPDKGIDDFMLAMLIGHGVHLMDTLRFFGGDVVAVTACGYDEKRGAVSTALLEWASGATGTFQLVCTVKMDWCEGLMIHGTNGSVVASIPFPYFHRASEVFIFDDACKEYRIPATPDSDQYERQVEGFASAILEGRPVSPSGHDGLAAQKALYAIHESQRTGKRVEIR